MGGGELVRVSFGVTDVWIAGGGSEMAAVEKVGVCVKGVNSIPNSDVFSCACCCCVVCVDVGIWCVECECVSDVSVA